MNTNVRVRYAPSPTGLQHIGGIRTALFNYFFARSSGGTFVLRIEDTDQSRYRDDALRDIHDTFSWLGIHWDEGPDVGGPYEPYVQSERADLYRRYAMQLIDGGHAYYDYTSSKPDGDNDGVGGERASRSRTDTVGTNAAAGERGARNGDGSAPDDRRVDEPDGEGWGGYNYEGRDLSEEQIQQYKAAGVVPVVRLRVPLDGKTEFHDLVLGRIKRKNKDIPADPILLKSDGLPTYHLANVVDDHLMGITHVLRAQEWVPSTPIHLLMYRAFDWEPPEFAHLPMVMGKDGSKLSKRHGATSVIEFRRAGYTPEALINYVALLGWAYDDSREFFSTADLERLFDIGKINKAPAVFDYKKLQWFNGAYIREYDDERLIAELLPYLQHEGFVGSPLSEDERCYIEGYLPIVRERLKLLGDIVPLTRFLYRDVTTWERDQLIPKKTTAAETAEYLDLAEMLIRNQGVGDEDALEEAFRATAEERGIKVGNMLMPLRVAVTGSRVSPPLFPSIRLIGIEKTLQRVRGAREVLKQSPPALDHSQEDNA